MTALRTPQHDADEALERLYDNGMFKGYPDSHLYEAVDGVGFLCLALMFLETRGKAPLSKFGNGL